MTEPAIREALLARLLDALQEDERIVGTVLVGSGATGFLDEESDLDVVAAVGGTHDATAVHQKWGHRLEQRLPVVYRGRAGPFQLAHRLHGALLDAGGPLLELDLSFVSVAELRALRPRWKVLFDRTGEVHGRMAAPRSCSTRRGNSISGVAPRSRSHSLLSWSRNWSNWSSWTERATHHLRILGA